MKLLCCALYCVICTCALAQSAHQLPFGGGTNSIDLTVANTTASPIRDALVEVVSSPRWLRFLSVSSVIPLVKAGTSSTARFEFIVDRSAPVGTDGEVVLSVVSAGRTWTKLMRVVVLAPEDLLLFQNFPNPFNPATTFSYQLPEPAHVSLTVYTLLGQQVGEVFEGTEPAGYHEHAWRGTTLASGIYLYQLVVRGNSGETRIFRRLMHTLK